MHHIVHLSTDRYGSPFWDIGEEITAVVTFLMWKLYTLVVHATHGDSPQLANMSLYPLFSVLLRVPHAPHQDRRTCL